jgi:hypothetical protein
MNSWKNYLLILVAVLSFASCGSSEPEYADPEVHEKTEQLKEQYTPLIAGAWHYENVADKQRFFERLTFLADGTLTGMRKWQKRSLVTINGDQHYTDWEDVEQMNGSFTGYWRLQWERDEKGEGHDMISLYARYDDPANDNLAYSHIMLFDYADETTLRLQSYFPGDDGWTVYQRGDSEPSF